jgi:hypothetical protein
VPGTIVYDRTKTVIRRHVAPGIAVPLHPEAAAFADHYGFTIDVLAGYRPIGMGRVERQVNIVRDHVPAGRSFDSIAELDGALPVLRLPTQPGRRLRAAEATGGPVQPATPSLPPTRRFGGR